MNYPIEFEKVIYSAVVPVKCGSSFGTAFFVAPDILVTARHILKDYFLNQSPILLTQKQILCTAVELGDSGESIDIALLKSLDYSESNYLKLLSSPFNENRRLTIVGYPSEFGNCSELISLDVHDRLETKVHEYDTMVVRTDALAFGSYKGFSGSPVLNEKGSVIGIATNQFGNSLGYLSIKSLTDKLKQRNVNFSEEWQSEDFTPLGRGTSQKQVKKALEYASLRYKEQLHISNPKVDEVLDTFAIRKNEDLREKLQKVEKMVLEDLQKVFKPYFEQYQKGNFSELYNRLYFWQEKYVNPQNKKVGISSDDLRKVDLFLRNEFLQLPSWVEEYEWDIRQLLVLHGIAGMGKTHYVCATAKRLSSQMNVYLLFGSQFSEDKDFEGQLCNLMNIGYENLDSLESKLISEDANALIIIDAINEGATEIFWNRAFKQLKTTLKEHKHLKFIISFRDDEQDTYKIEADYELPLDGFKTGIDEAIKKYFEYYDLSANFTKSAARFKREFQNPLFLSIFCEVAQYESIDYYSNCSYSDLFRLYIKSRNEIISKRVDDDPHRNITQRFLSKAAGYSLYYKDCADIPREKARFYSNQISRNRVWSQSLLYWVIKENLMLVTGAEGEKLMFGYQKMGDVLMADIFSQNKMSDQRKIDFVIEKAYCHDNDNYNYRNFLLALLPDWKLTPKLLQSKKSHKLKSLILGCLRYQCTNKQYFLKWLKDNGGYNLDILHDYLIDLPLSEFEYVHHKLMNMQMVERDLKWTTCVNSKYRYENDNSLERAINIPISTENDYKKYSLYLCWMCTSPHPEIRGRALRKLVYVLDEQPSLASYVLAHFYNCNDPYVIQVCTCALYGHLLRRRDTKECNAMAKDILHYFYSERSAPEDVLIRQWTLLILLFTDELNGNHHYASQTKPPFTSENPFDKIIDKNASNDETYFGESYGSRKMHFTLFDRMTDFNRYILGSNYSPLSSVFFILENDELNSVKTDDIALMIANVAKRDFGWSDSLGREDVNMESLGRYNNKRERFGKKYVWLALYKVEALLCDHVKVIDDRKYTYQPNKGDVEKKTFPWHTHEYSRIDPTLSVQDERNQLDFKVGDLENIMNISNEEWMDEKFPIPAPRLIFSDSSNQKWAVLTCYDGHNEPESDNTIKDLFLYSNAAFIKKKDLSRYIGWAKTQNFYGRWMPEHRNGSIDYLWNEYPWSDTYKRTLPDMEDFMRSFKGKQFTLELSYETQLQEDWTGIDDDDNYLRDASFPEHRVMESLRLYTAERGVIRSLKDNQIVSVNFKIGRMNGLAIRQDFLDLYLNKRGLALVYYCLGEKYVRMADSFADIKKRFDLSGAYYYDRGQIKEIQSMHISSED